MKKKGFTLIELLVVIAIIALLLSILMPSLRKVKAIAMEVVCRANVRQWGIIYAMYTEDNNGFFNEDWVSVTDGSQLWPAPYTSYYNDPAIQYCPKAKTRKQSGPLGFWGPMPSGTGQWPDALAGTFGSGSYGVNTYASSGILAEINNNYWKRTGQSNSSQIPILGEAAWLHVRAKHDDIPPTYFGERSSAGKNEMRSMCVDRHNGYINMLFMDWSTRKVGLKELWTLKWHKSFNTANAYTIAGNGGDEAALAAFWDALAPWMSKYKEY